MHASEQEAESSEFVAYVLLLLASYIIILGCLLPYLLVVVVVDLCSIKACLI
jgi:hypothetical protein